MARVDSPLLPALIAACLMTGCQSSVGTSSTTTLAEPGQVDPPPVEQAVQSTALPEVADAPAAAPREDYKLLLRQAFEAYRNGDLETAMLAYERVLGSADDPHDQVRALISLAMIRLLPSSKAQNAEAAAIVMEELDRRVKQNGLQHEYFGELELLGLIQGRERENRELRAANARLRKSLAGKEELVRQLRALSVEGG